MIKEKTTIQNRKIDTYFLAAFLPKRIAKNLFFSGKTLKRQSVTL